MPNNFKSYCEKYFSRLACGYARSLDDSGVRAWLPGHHNWMDAGGAHIATSRIFPSLCAWLSNPSRPKNVSWGKMEADVEALVLKVYDNFFEPGAPGCVDWTKHEPCSQPTVDASPLAYGTWLVRDSLWKKVPAAKKKHWQDWMQHFGSAEPWETNWALFWITNHTVRKTLGFPFDQNLIKRAWERIDNLAREGGWMVDGLEGRHFDDYNWWVFGTHELWWDQMDGASDPACSQRLKDRLKQRLQDYPYFFGADGSYTEFGRSLAYKFGRLGAPILAYRAGIWPHSAGLLKRIVRLHLQWYDAQGAVDRAGHFIRQELSEFGHAAVREDYIDTGHPYWSMHAFTALWQLPEDDPIWTAEEEPLPVEKADFTRAITAPGWILSGTREDGQVRRYSLGSTHGEDAPYQAKYGKFVYSSHFPVNFGAVEGEFGPDNCLCMTDGKQWAHPRTYEKFSVSREALRASYVFSLEAVEIPCETILIPLGASHLRLHRLQVPHRSGALRLAEGGFPLGYAPGQVPEKSASQKFLESSAFVWGKGSLLRSLSGWGSALMPAGFKGREDLNGVHALALTPMLERVIANKIGIQDIWLASLCWSAVGDGGEGFPRKPEKTELKIRWTKDGSVRVQIGEKNLEVPPLA
jgi:hypothetical protein